MKVGEDSSVIGAALLTVPNTRGANIGLRATKSKVCSVSWGALVHLPLRIVRDFTSCADLESTLGLSLEVSLFQSGGSSFARTRRASAQSRSESTEAEKPRDPGNDANESYSV